MYDHYWIRKADAVVTLTKGDAMDWRRISKHVYVIPNVVHLNESGKYSTNTNKRAIFVGRLVEQKGLPELLTVWRFVHQNILTGSWMSMVMETSYYPKINSRVLIFKYIIPSPIFLRNILRVPCYC